MTEERYMVFKNRNQIWGIDTMILNGVLDSPEIIKVPFVPLIVEGVILFKEEIVPVLKIFEGKDGILIIVDSVYGKIGFMVEEILGIYNKEDILRSDAQESSETLGEINGEKINYFSLNLINEFFKDIEIKN